jgi:hypothetical protein
MISTKNHFHNFTKNVFAKTILGRLRNLSIFAILKEDKRTYAEIAQ